MKRALLVLGLLAILLTACEYVEEDTGLTPIGETGLLDDIVRFVDSEYGVVCYVYKGYEKGGISCLPLEGLR